MNIPCQLVLKQCLPCNDDPIRNITAEAPDVDVFIGFRDFKWNPPLGVTYFQLSCKAICFSEVSQRDADLCALRDAQACDWNGASDPKVPPVPPCPSCTGGKGTNTLPPANPRNPIRRYGNSVQTCDAQCPDGSPFTETVPAGTFTELSQALADAKAKSLACKLAQQHLFCISGTPPAACVGENYFFFLTTNSGENLIWSVDGNLPPGLDFDPFIATITGTPTVAGSYSFVVEATDSSGRSQAKVLTICIMEIVTASPLPIATLGNVYAEPLVQQPATVSSEVWTLVGGSLPPGITLSTNGSLTGIPTEVGTSTFTLRVDATCDGMPASCQKSFTLEVSGVDCMGNPQSIGTATWTLINLPAQGTLVISGGDGTFVNVSTTDLYVEATADICNPHVDPYAFTVDFTWNVAGFAFVTSGATVRLNGVDTSSPIQNGNGSFTYSFAGTLLSGVNTLNVVMNMNGIFNGTMNGTITIRPLTPP